MQGDVSRELKNNYSKGMEHAYEFYKELANQPKAQQQFLAQISENLAKLNPEFYPSALDAQRSLQVRFDNQTYLATHQQHNQEMSHS